MKNKKKNNTKRNGIPEIFTRKYIYYYYSFFWFLIILYLFLK